MNTLSDNIKYIDFEISSICNAGCPVCPRRHIGRFSEFTQTYWTIEETKRTIDVDIIKNLYGVLFCGNFGDAMGNPDVLEISRYFRNNNLNMSIHVKTNGGIGEAETYAEMAKLNTIFTFGLDGVGETNELHRVNVKWDKVVQNVQSFTKNCAPHQFEIQFIMWNENIMQIIPMIEFIQSIGIGKLFLRKPYTTGVKTEVFNMKGESTHFLTEVKDERLLKYLDTTWEFNKLDELKEEIKSLNLIEQPIFTGDFRINERMVYPKKTYEYTEFEFEPEILEKLKNHDSQTCFSKNTKNPSDLTQNLYNIYITHNKLLMPCCFIPPNISNRMFHTSGEENDYQKEVLNKMITIGFDEFNLNKNTLREAVDSGVLNKFVYDDLLNKTQLKLCTQLCNKCSGSGINDNK
jgi:hypothetical protein